MQREQKKDPPAPILRFLECISPPSLYEGIEGDLLEQFEADCESLGHKKANLKLIWNVIRFIRPGIIFRNKFSFSLMSTAMLKNYTIVALRNFYRNKAYALINITGFSLALAIAIVLFWIVRFEKSFDTFHTHAGRLYQIISFDKFGEPNAYVPQGVIKALKEELPEVEEAASVLRWDPSVIKVGEKNLSLDNTYFIHPRLLKMIDVEWVAGSPERSLQDSHQVVVDESTARKLFNGDAMGKTLKYDNALELTVAGVIRDMPVNSEFQFRMILSYETLKLYQDQYKNEDHWGGGDSFFHGYVLLKPSAKPRDVEAKLKKIAERHEDYVSFTLNPITEMHFYEDNDPFNYYMPSWLVQALIIIAVFIVIIACINFVNLATVQATQRSKEIAVRKVMGSSRTSLISQFFTETTVLVLISFLLSTSLAAQLLQFGDQLLNTKAGSLNIWTTDTFIFLALLALVVILLSGFYPAVILSGFEPVKMLRSKLLSFSSRGTTLRQTLVVTQFVIAQVMLICMLIGTKQIKYFYSKDLGFDQDAVVNVNMPDRGNSLLREQYRQQLLHHPEIKDITFGLISPSSNRNWWWSNVEHPRLLNGEATFRMQFIDLNYLDFYKIPILAGRNLTEADTTGFVLVNEKAVSDMGYRKLEEALGEEVIYWGNKCRIAGVVQNYHSQSLKSTLAPHIYIYGPWNFQTASIKIDPSRSEAALHHIEQYWKEGHPDNYFEYYFLSDNIREFYEDERKFSNFLALFTTVGIFIGCLGLYGLISFVCVRRTKEIGIRKVLGAGMAHIVSILSSDFLKLIAISFFISVPLAWILMNQFLESYTYKTPIDWTVFLIAGLSSLLIAIITISIQAVRSALANPVESLKHE